MKVICAGLCKTGTKSIAKALRILGYTVYDYLEHRDFHANEWRDIYCHGKQPNFASMYQDVDVVIGQPASFWYEEIFEAFPDSKVILSVRSGSDEDWAESWSKQCEISHNPDFSTKVAIRWLSSANHRKEWQLLDMISVATFGSLNPKSKNLFKKKYREHNERAQAVIPKEKLLIYNVKQGWKPLCEFLGEEEPDQVFPLLNVSGSFSHQVIGSQLQKFKLNLLIILAVLVFLVAVLCLMYL